MVRKLLKRVLVRSWLRVRGVKFACLVALMTSAASCSLLFSTKDQCISTSDCLARGTAFAQTQCVAQVCVSNTQVDSGASDDRFACSALPAQGVDPSKLVSLSIRYLDLNRGVNATKSDVRLCSATDVECVNPRATLRAQTAVRDGGGSGLDGGVSEGWVALGGDGLMTASVEKGFQGFFEVRSAEFAPAFRYTSPALRNDKNEFEQIMLRPTEIATLARQALKPGGTAYDPTTRGIVFLYARDCNQQPVTGIRFTVATGAKDAIQIPFYVNNDLTPSTTEAKTLSLGIGGFANMATGLYTFTAEFADTGKVLGSGRASIRAGTNTMLTILPSP